MDNHINNQQQTHNGKTVTGIVFLGLGLAILLKHIHFFLFPHWLFSWPLMFILFGLYIGSKSNFKKSSWIILTMLGVIFLLPNIIPTLGMSLLWPLLLIAFGANIIIRRDQRWNRDHWEKRDANQ